MDTTAVFCPKPVIFNKVNSKLIYCSNQTSYVSNLILLKLTSL